MVAAAVALAALTGGALVGLVATIGGDGSRIDTTDTSTNLTPTTTPSGPTADGGELDPDGASSTDTDRSALTVDPGSTTTGSSPEATVANPTGSTTDGPASEPRAADERTEHVARFRELVTADALRSDPLSDQDIEDLAVALCVIASVEDTTGFATARAQIATEQASSGALTAEQLSGTINAAVQAFCPAEATRLGL